MTSDPTQPDITPPDGGERDVIVSVVLPTKDRGPEIDLTLDALLRQDHRGFEVVIVDNLSCAEDAERLRARAAAAPQRLRYVREDRLGLNNARNRGIAASRGRILAFLDDDAIAPPSWVANIERAFAAHPAAWAIGSKVISRFTTPPPAWLDERLQLFLSGFDRGESIETLHYDDYPRGANMAFRREAFARCGPFRDCLDRKGDSLLSYGDIEMCYRVERSGHDVLYIPDAGVEHLIRGDRLTREWFRRRFYWQGRSIAVFERMHFGRLRVLRKLPYRLARCVFGGDEFSRQLYRGTIAAAAASLLRSRFE